MYPHNPPASSKDSRLALASGVKVIWHLLTGNLDHQGTSVRLDRGQNLVRRPQAFGNGYRAVWVPLLGTASMWRLKECVSRALVCPRRSHLPEADVQPRVWPDAKAGLGPGAATYSITRLFQLFYLSKRQRWPRPGPPQSSCKHQMQGANRWTSPVWSAGLAWTPSQPRQVWHARAAKGSQRSRCDCPCPCRVASCTRRSSSRHQDQWNRTTHSWVGCPSISPYLPFLHLVHPCDCSYYRKAPR